MKLLKCGYCKIFLVHNKEELKRHEARYHDYQIVEYETHYPRLLSDKDFNSIVARGEERFKHALIVPENLVNLRSRNTGHGQQ